MTGKIDLKKIYHESKKERTKKTKMERALEGVVFCFPRNTTDDPNLKNNMTQDNTNR